jgi:hypothetical protein
LARRIAVAAYPTTRPATSNSCTLASIFDTFSTPRNESRARLTVIAPTSPPSRPREIASAITGPATQTDVSTDAPARMSSRGWANNVAYMHPTVTTRSATASRVLRRPQCRL